MVECCTHLPHKRQIITSCFTKKMHPSHSSNGLSFSRKYPFHSNSLWSQKYNWYDAGLIGFTQIKSINCREYHQIILEITCLQKQLTNTSNTFKIEIILEMKILTSWLQGRFFNVVEKYYHFTLFVANSKNILYIYYH